MNSAGQGKIGDTYGNPPTEYRGEYRDSDSVSQYTLSFLEAVQAMSNGLEVLCEGQDGAYKFNHAGQLFHFLSCAGWCNASLNGELCARKWKVVELSKYI